MRRSALRIRLEAYNGNASATQKAEPIDSASFSNGTDKMISLPMMRHPKVQVNTLSLLAGLSAAKKLRRGRYLSRPSRSRILL